MLALAASCGRPERRASVGIVNAGVEPIASEDFETTTGSGDGSAAVGMTWTEFVLCEVSTDVAHAGTKSLKFTFGPDADLENTRAEARFSLDAPITVEMWVEFWIHFPTNYYHRTQASGGVNNKLFRFWGNDGSANSGYTLNRCKWGASLLPDVSDFFESAAYPGDSVFAPEYVRESDGLVPTFDLWDEVSAPAVTDDERNQWNRFRAYAKLATGQNANDGAMTIWYNDSKIMEVAGLDFWSPDIARWDLGYLMGEANSGFENETLIYIDDIKVYAEDPGW